METSVLFKFIKMDLTQFATFENVESVNNTNIEVFNHFHFAYNFDKHLVLCKTITEANSREKVLIKAELDCLFEIDSESATAIESGNEAIIPPKVLAQFASLAYGTLRGVIYVKTSETAFRDFILPPFDVSTIFTETQRFHKIL